VAFAKRIAARLEEGRVSSQVDKLVLIAPPKFLGHLRSSLSTAAAGLVALTLDKELTQLPVDKLAGHLPEFF
jgi:protein required for attachment to host cells